MDSLNVDKKKLLTLGVLYVLAGVTFSWIFVYALQGRYFYAALNSITTFLLLDIVTTGNGTSTYWIHWFRKYNPMYYIVRTNCPCFQCKKERDIAGWQKCIVDWQRLVDNGDEIEADMLILMTEFPKEGHLLEPILKDNNRLRENALEHIKELEEKLYANN